MKIASDESSILWQIKADAVGQIPPHWKIRSVAELIRDGVLDKIQDGNHGESHPVASDYLPVGIPFLMSGNIRNGQVNMSGGKFLALEHARSLRVGHARRGDVLLTHKGNDLGRTAILREADWAVLTPQITYYRIKNLDALLPDFLKCVFESATFQHQFKRDSEQSTRPFVSISNQQNLYLPIPPIEEQRAIAQLLGTLQDKMELNRRMNETLEALARTIFKSWFVDFDPVRAKAEGRDSGLPKHIADVFPDRFQDSELGEIPVEWRVSTIGRELKTVLGGTPSRAVPGYWEGGSIPWINSGMVNEFRVIEPSEFITEAGLNSSATKLLPSRTTVIAITGATLGQVSLTEIDTCANQSVVGVLGRASIPSEFLYFWVKENIDDLVSWQSGGAQQHINKNNVNDLPLLYPNRRVMQAYSVLVRPIFDRIKINCFESLTLANLRDTLLPKLISGELRLNAFNSVRNKS